MSFGLPGYVILLHLRYLRGSSVAVQASNTYNEGVCLELGTACPVRVGGLQSTASVFSYKLAVGLCKLPSHRALANAFLRWMIF